MLKLVYVLIILHKITFTNTFANTFRALAPRGRQHTTMAASAFTEHGANEFVNVSFGKGIRNGVRKDVRKGARKKGVRKEVCHSSYSSGTSGALSEFFGTLQN